MWSKLPACFNGKLGSMLHTAGRRHLRDSIHATDYSSPFLSPPYGTFIGSRDDEYCSMVAVSLATSAFPGPSRDLDAYSHSIALRPRCGNLARRIPLFKFPSVR